jgi:hypothetical protein
MLLTEEQAKKKECCGAPVVVAEYETSRVTRLRQSCAASDCMGWRWGAATEDSEGRPIIPPFQEARKKFVNVGPPRVCDECKGDGCEHCDGGRQQMTAPVGYCGLAGIPEVG